jgi:hypothetical protein
LSDDQNSTTAPNILDFSDPQGEYERVRRALQQLYNACEYRANRDGGDFGPDIGPAAYEALAALGVPTDGE